MKKLVILALCVLISACSPKYTGTSMNEEATPTVVVVKDNDTRESFLQVIENWLGENGYNYQVVPFGSQNNPEKVTLRYNGTWSWDLALFMREAQIDAYKAQQKIGGVHYYAPSGLNLNKFGHAETRIRNMMDALFGKIDIKEANMRLTQNVNTPKETE